MRWSAALLLLSIAFPAQAQVQEQAKTISPLKVETDQNAVNITTGRARIATPKIAIPAAPRMSFDLIQNAMPYLVARMTSAFGEYVQSSVAVHTGNAASDSFNCLFDDVCISRKRNGASLDGNIAVGGPYTFTESGTGAVYTFDRLQYDSGFNTNPRQLQYYASSIVYPDGETISLTYETGSGFGQTRHRLSNMSSSLGYYLTFSYQGTDPTTGLWGVLAQASLYGPGLLGQLTYATNGNITDLAGRVFNCTGCANAIGSQVETSGGTLQLPGESAQAKVVTPDSATSLVVGGVTQDGVGWNYSYANLQPATFPDYRYTGVTVTGPDGFNQIYAIDQATATKPNLITSVTDSLGRTTSYVYDGNIRPTRVTAPEGSYVQITYDTYGNITNKLSQPKPGSDQAAISESSAIDQTSCDQYRVLCFRPVSYTDGLGRVTNYTYDNGGRLISILMPADAGGVRRATYLTYDSSYTAPTEVRICALGITCRTAQEFKTQYTYFGATALPLTETRIDTARGLVATTTYGYDPAGRPLVIDGPLAGTGDAVYFRYDVIGRKTWEIGAVGANGKRVAKRFTYRDADDKVTKVETGTLPDAFSTAFTLHEQEETTYDARRYPERSARIAGGVTYTVTQRSFLDRGLPECAAVRMNPDAFASLPSSACSLGTEGSFGPDRITKQLYDGAGQPTVTHVALGTPDQADEVTLTHTPNGQRATLIDGEGAKTTWEYDGHDRLAKLIYPQRSAPGSPNNNDYEGYLYDANGNLEERRLRSGHTLTYTYDALNRQVSKTTQYVSYYDFNTATTYDLLGRPLSVTSASGQTVSYTYDALGRMIEEADNYSGGGAKALQYDLAGRMTRLTYGNSGLYIDYDRHATGDISAIRENGATSGLGVLGTYSYDDLGRRTVLVRGNQVDSHWRYDPIGRLDRIVHNASGSADDLWLTYKHNPAGQIVSTDRDNDAYAFPLPGDTDVIETSDGLNQLATQYPGMGTLEYDARGNITRLGSATYKYTSENRLAEKGVDVALAYDPVGRLAYTGPFEGGGTYRDYLGSQLIGEAGHARLRSYVPGPGVDEVLTWYEFPTSGPALRRWLLADERGSTIGVTDATGAVIGRLSYNDYGTPAATNPASVRFQYTGQQWLPELGMHYYKARIYYPQIGRFMQTDPIGYGDGVNLYAYVGGDPVNSLDDTGNQAIRCSGNCAIALQAVNDFGRGALSLPRDAGAGARHVAALSGALGAENAARARLVGDLVDRSWAAVQSNPQEAGRQLQSLIANNKAFLSGRAGATILTGAATGPIFGPSFSGAAFAGGIFRAFSQAASALEKGGVDAGSLSNSTLSSVAAAGLAGANVRFDAKSGNLTATTSQTTTGSLITKTKTFVICNVNTEKGC